MSTNRARMGHVPRVLVLALACAALLAGCGTAPQVELSPNNVKPTLELPIVEPTSARPTPMVEHPPIEPVEPPESVAAGIPHPRDVPVPADPAPPTSTPTPAPGPPIPLAATPEAPSEDQQVAALLADLARYAGMTADDIRRELSSASQALARQRTDANRVRLALLYTFTHSPQDDQRALQLLENVARSVQGMPGVKQLAGVLQSQLVERVRAVREEQQKAEAAIQKLDALRVMERSLLRDRVRSGSGGAAGGSGGGSGGR